MDFSSRKSFLFHKRIPTNSEIVRSKLSRDRIHNLFQKVDVYYNKLSPSNCSKNMLAINSNIDSEIENAKSLASLPLITTSRSQNASLSPSKPRLALPFLTNTPSRLMKLQNESFSELGRYSKVSLSGKEFRSSRLLMIDKIIHNCSGLKKKIGFDKHRLKADELSELKGKKALLTVRKEDKLENMEQTIIERCRKHFEDIELDEEDEIKLTQALKRGKKIWKQNHFAFIKNIEKSLRGVEHQQKP